jgi:hypothetical protein
MHLFKRAALIMMPILLASATRAEITATLTISGELDEIAAVLQQLQTMGAGHAAGATNEQLKLQVHSITSGNEATQPDLVWVAPGLEQPSAAPEAPAAPALGLQNLTLTPPTAPAGASLVVTVEAVDEARAIDTMSATFGGAGPTIDLHDNGTDGDTTAADNIWSGTLMLPADAAPGANTLRVEAFDSNGTPLQVSGAEGTAPLTAATEITVSQ